MSTHSDLAGRLAALRAAIGDLATQVVEVREQASDMAAADEWHGWHGVAGGLRAAEDNLRTAGGILFSSQDAAGAALATVEQISRATGASGVAELLAQVFAQLDTCAAAMEQALREVSEAHQSGLQTETPALTSSALALSAAVRSAQQHLSALRESFEAEHEIVLAMLGLPGESAGPLRTVEGPARLWQPQHPNSSRHLLNSITMRSVRKPTTTVILPDVDVDADLTAIREGLAKWNSRIDRYETPSGRLYGMEKGGKTYPDRGPGLEKLDRPEFEALQHYIAAAGDRSQAEATMDRIPHLPRTAKDRAYEVFRHHRHYRG